MPASPKLPANIAERVEAGERPADLAVEYGVSRHAVEKRAKRNAILAHDDQERTDWLTLVGEYEPLGWKDTPQRRADILEAIESGVTLTAAARSAGISLDTLSVWRKADPDFSEMIDTAQGNLESLVVNRWVQATERDWRAGEALLTRHPEYRERWGQNQSDRSGGIQVIINVPNPIAADTAQIIEAEIVDSD